MDYCERKSIFVVLNKLVYVKISLISKQVNLEFVKYTHLKQNNICSILKFKVR